MSNVSLCVEKQNKFKVWDSGQFNDRDSKMMDGEAAEDKKETGGLSSAESSWRNSVTRVRGVEGTEGRRQMKTNRLKD